jgi:hypothetical protein
LKNLRVTLNGQPVNATFKAEAANFLVTLDVPLPIKTGDTLTLVLS